VKDRWSRYIGAMGIEAVSKQSKASILLFGLSSLGIEIAKNIVLSGCRRLSVQDGEVTTWKDLSGQFYLSEQEVGRSRVDSCLYKLQDLNNYVRVDSVNLDLTKAEDLAKLKDYQVVISTVHRED
jgi:molybdopterin/thiamine biosynthesis adenylyltransferase